MNASCQMALVAAVPKLNAVVYMTAYYTAEKKFLTLMTCSSSKQNR